MSLFGCELDVGLFRAAQQEMRVTGEDVLLAREIRVLEPVEHGGETPVQFAPRVHRTPQSAL